MKKTIFTMLLCVIGMSVSFAQESNPFSFGVKGGLNYTGLLVENPDGGMIAGGFGGLYTNYRVSEKFALQLELQYGQHGVYSNYGMEVPAIGLNPELPAEIMVTSTGQVDIRTNYLSIPVIAQYYLGANKNFAVQAGVVFSYLTDYTVEYDGVTISDLPDEVDAQLHDRISAAIVEGTQFKNFDFALTAGAAYYIPSTNFHIDARVNYGLADTADSDNPDDWKKTIAIQCGIGYTF